VDPDDIARSTIALDRQDRPVRLDVRGRPIVPSRVPETKPTPLQNAFIELSVVVLISGVVTIAALELGTPLSSPLVKIAVLVGGSVLVVVTVDAIVRIWRAALAWLPVDRGRGLFRFVWVGVLVLSLVVVIGFVLVVLTA
jgi:hypothetical protein